MKRMLQSLFRAATAMIVLLATIVPALESSAANSGPSVAPNVQLPTGVKFVSKGTIIPGTPEAYKFVFDDGLRVILLPDNRNPIAMLRIRFDAGSNRETKGETGLAHFFEHMMFRKTTATPEGEYDRVLSSLGGEGNAGTSTDMVSYFSTFPAPALETMLALESQRMQGLELVEPYFSVEKGAVVSERALHYDNNPRNRAREIINSVTERDTSYEWMTIGAKSDVQNMKVESVRKFYSDFYVPNNAILTLGGAFRLNEGLALVHKYFSQWKAKEVPPHQAFPKDYLSRNSGKSFVCSEDVNEQNYSIVYPSFRNSFKDQVYSAAFEIALNDHPEGTLEHRLMKKKLATSFGFSKRFWQQVSQPIDVYINLTKEQSFAAARAFYSTAVEQVRKKTIDDRFRKRVLKAFTVNDAEHSLKMTTLAEDYEDFEARFNNFRIGEEEKRLVREMKTEEFHKWIRDNLDSATAYVTGVVPNGMAAPCSELAKHETKQEKR